MATLFIQIAFVLALISLFGWLTVRVRQAPPALVRGAGLALFGLLTALCLTVLGLVLLGFYRLYRPPTRPAAEIQIRGSSEQLTRGQRLAHICIGCHSSTGDLPLDGGTENHLAEVGTLYAPNLTPGGPLADWTDGEIARAIRQGIDKNGHALILMPSDQYHIMSDADVRAVVAYLRTQPRVVRQVPARQLNLIGVALVGVGVLPYSPQPPIADSVTAPPVAATEDYGRYLVTISGCGACHGNDLRGGTSDFTPYGPNLPAILSRWSADDFVETMRTGTDPNGHTLDPERMPWPNFDAAFSNEELRAIYKYLQTLPSTDGASE